MRSRGLLCLAILLLPGLASAQGKAKPLQQVVLNMRGANETAVRKEATRQTNPTVWPVFRSNPPKAPAFESFEGLFVPAADTTQLAIFSDDGCTITVDDVTPGKKKSPDIHNPVLKRLREGQHLPALAQSFHILQLKDKKGKKIAWEKGNIYRIRVQYSNIVHTDKKDVDGCTLFAYNGGGRVLPPGIKLAWRPRPTEHPSSTSRQHAARSVREIRELSCLAVPFDKTIGATW